MTVAVLITVEKLTATLCVARNGVIGAVIYNRFIKEGWDIAARKQAVTCADLVRHIARVCDIAGDTLHAGIGSDFDGGYGVESTPTEIDTVSDLQKLGDALSDTQFNDDAIANILGMNWVRLLQRVLPQ